MNNLTKSEELLAQQILQNFSYDEMSEEQEKLVSEYETEIFKKKIDKIKNPLKDELKEKVHNMWLNYEIADGTEDNLFQYIDSIIVKQKGYKIVKIYVEDGKLFYDIAVFGNDSLIIDNVQLCEKLYEKISSEKKKEIETEYEKELFHNYINDTLIIM